MAFRNQVVEVGFIAIRVVVNTTFPTFTSPRSALANITSCQNQLKSHFYHFPTKMEDPARRLLCSYCPFSNHLTCKCVYGVWQMASDQFSPLRQQMIIWLKRSIRGLRPGRSITHGLPFGVAQEGSRKR